jgi:hypothetical protein
MDFLKSNSCPTVHGTTVDIALHPVYCCLASFPHIQFENAELKELSQISFCVLCCMEGCRHCYRGLPGSEDTRTPLERQKTFDH